MPLHITNLSGLLYQHMNVNMSDMHHVSGQEEQHHSVLHYWVLWMHHGMPSSF